MNFLHFVIDTNENLIESTYSKTAAVKMSLQALVQIKGGVYKIWNKQTNEVEVVSN